MLDGITRDSVIQIAEHLCYKVEYPMITRDQLYAAHEAFITGTAAEIVPIAAVDKRKIGAGGMGAITRQIQQAYYENVRGVGYFSKVWCDLI